VTIAILLAAGAGTRFGGDKLLAPLHGKPLVLHAVDALRAAVADLGHALGEAGLSGPAGE
jgi:CTP:molybdopterin cytidylyltransferase MocA